MTVIVCPMEAASAQCVARAARRFVSLLSPNLPPPVFDLPAKRRLHLAFNDIAEPTEGLVHPTEAHIAALLGFLHDWDRRSPLLIHCLAGVSRSTAAGYVAACLREGPGAERQVARRLRAAAPFATPNSLMIALADRLLERGGAMVAAVGAIGRGEACNQGSPFDL